MNKWMLPIVLLLAVLSIGLLVLMLSVLPKTLVLFTLGLLVMVILPLVLLCRQDAFSDDLSDITPEPPKQAKTLRIKR